MQMNINFRYFFSISILLFFLLTTGFYKVEKSRSSFQLTDSTELIQQKINRLSRGGVLDGKNKTYYVTALWLKSNITIKDINLIAIPTDFSDVSVLNIGNDLSNNRLNKSKEGIQSTQNTQASTGINNIKLKNISIDGNRCKQKKLGQENRDGGKHGISIKGYVSDIYIDNVRITNCATDGIAIYRGLHTNLISGVEKQASKNIQIKNLVSSYNRRHGGSGDSIENFVCENCTFSNNGFNVDNSGEEGVKGAIYLGKLYGNGWDMEGYGTGSRISEIKFINSRFVNNAGAGLVFYDTSDQADKSFLQRENILLINCIFDTGKYNPVGDFCLTFSSTIKNKTNSKKLYRNILIKDCTLQGRVILRSCDKISFLNTNQDYNKSLNRGILDHVSNISIRGGDMSIRNWITDNARFIN